MSTINITKIPDYRKNQILSQLKENWQDALNNDYRVTINRREKIYEMLNILEGDLESKRTSRINPNFYADKSMNLNLNATDDTNIPGKKGFNARSIENNDFLNIKAGKKLKNFPKSSPPRNNEMKTNLINLDTSRDQLGASNLNFNPQAAQIRSMAILNSENKENQGF
jgi:hypothetical protein